MTAILRPSGAPPTRRQLAVASISPALLVAVGYIDPGNWGTDIAAGARFGTRLIWVLVAANVVAIFLQYLAAKLGVATGSHLAAVAGRQLSRPGRRALAAVTVVSLIATDLAEFLGVVVALQILIGGSLFLDVAIGIVIVFGLLALGRRDTRVLERGVVALIAVVGLIYLVELWLAQPSLHVVAGLRPSVPHGSIPVAVGMLGATVMPHNLFLHSGIVHWRPMAGDRRRWLRRVAIGSAVALTGALLINVAILVMTAATSRSGAGAPATLEAAAHSLTPALGPLASGGFALALLAAGVAATVTSGVAGDLVLDGLTPLRMSTFTRRAIAVVPASIGIVLGLGEITALVASQVVLSVALPLVALVLVRLTNDRLLMMGLANRRVTRIAACGVVGALWVANLALLASVL